MTKSDFVAVALAAFLGGFVFPPLSDPMFWAGLIALVMLVSRPGEKR